MVHNTNCKSEQSTRHFHRTRLDRALDLLPLPYQDADGLPFRIAQHLHVSPAREGEGFLTGLGCQLAEGRLAESSLALLRLLPGVKCLFTDLQRVHRAPRRLAVAMAQFR